MLSSLACWRQQSRDKSSPLPLSLANTSSTTDTFPLLFFIRHHPPSATLLEGCNSRINREVKVLISISARNVQEEISPFVSLQTAVQNTELLPSPPPPPTDIFMPVPANSDKALSVQPSLDKLAPLEKFNCTEEVKPGRHKNHKMANKTPCKVTRSGLVLVNTGPSLQLITNKAFGLFLPVFFFFFLYNPYFPS